MRGKNNFPAAFILARSKRGFTLLIAILVSGVLLAVGLSIFNIASKELILSSAGRESQFAFYAADAGIECALFADRIQDAFIFNKAVAGVNCGGGSVDFTKSADSASLPFTTTSDFRFYLNGAGTGACADVHVEKWTDNSATSTQVDSRGYNTCDTVNPRRVERGIRTFF